ncbi:GNAT family N-acetyltransferase [Phenylobacterium sp.]|uniref:GNAT family N-acetyltransferase n=1 Tax=Phenylobacterium sp. TaxID=1871053 RepID=UPI003982F674
MDVTIRECTPGDAEALSRVGQATFLETFADVLPTADIFAHCEGEHGRLRYAQWLGKPGYGFWIAEVAATGAPVGYIMVAPADLPIPTADSDMELKRIYLLHRFQGSGLGVRLMETAVQAARGAGAKRLLLGVYAGNARAIAFYARHDFATAGVRKFQVGANTYDDLVLAREL